jgi:hypothetical protein
MLKGITTIDVRECSAKSNNEHVEYTLGSNRTIEKLKGLKHHSGGQHIKTYSHDSRTK